MNDARDSHCGHFGWIAIDIKRLTRSLRKCLRSGIDSATMPPPLDHNRKFQKFESLGRRIMKQAFKSSTAVKIVWYMVILGCVWSGGNDIFEAWRHTGPGYIEYEDPDREVLVAETIYKRENYITGGGMILFGVLLSWAIVRKELSGT